MECIFWEGFPLLNVLHTCDVLALLVNYARFLAAFSFFFLRLCSGAVEADELRLRL